MFELSDFDFSSDSSQSYSLQINCPACLHNGTFEPLPAQQDFVASLRDGFGNYQKVFRFGMRICPAEICRMLVFFAYEEIADELETHPGAGPNLDPTNLPDKILEALKEAVKCYDIGCYVAAALMVRKTLEEICHDLNFKGKNLEQRIDELKAKVSFPSDLLDSLHDLRLLGNDAAHIESRHFEDVGREELDASIAVIRELLKGLYQYKVLKEKLGALKKPKTQ